MTLYHALLKQQESLVSKSVTFPQLSLHAAAAVKSLQLCLTLCDCIDGNSPGSSVPGILQAKILEWVAISFSNAYMHAKSLQSCLTLCPPGSSVHGILQANPPTFAPTALISVLVQWRKYCFYQKSVSLSMFVYVPEINFFIFVLDHIPSDLLKEVTPYL